MFPWSDPPRPLRFDHFMAAALHDPDHGYYARRIREVGSRGDFSTTSTLSPALGRAIGHWASKALSSTGCRDLIELGPGSGELAQTVLASLPWHRRIRTRLHLVETSDPLRQQQQSRLGQRARWHSSIEHALNACQGRACIYSNEFVDAFPVRRFKRQDDRWLEEVVTPGRSHWEPAPELPPSSTFSHPWDDGQVVEVHASYHEWLQKAMRHWHRGRMLTIDYGSRVENLYHRSPSGSLRGYFHHQLVTGPELLERAGHQDLTSDVNFSDLIEWSSPYAHLVDLRSQAEFMAPHLNPDQPTDAFVSDALGAGGAFQCLDQRAGGAPS